MSSLVKGLIKGAVASAASFGAFYAGTLLGLKVRVLSYERNPECAIDNEGKGGECYDDLEV